MGGINRQFTYDDENELTSVWVTNIWRSDFVYDGKMRRRIEKDYSWNGSAWTQTNEIHFIYDGNVVIQERDANNLPQVTYTRGNDLSGTLQGAGGIGGLLARTDMGLWTVGSGQATAFYHADGNGNIAMMINNLQLIVAKYLYDPFGNTLSLSGSLAEANTYRFSSKEWNDNAGLYYYLYRYYDPNLQRWPNQDPIGEWGGLNLYGYVGNNPVNWIDPLGLTLVVTGDQSAFNQALAYLYKDPTMKQLINDLNNSDNNYNIVMNNNDDDSYDPSTRTINWDPHSALRTKCGSSQTPALGLGHEMGHADGSSFWHHILQMIPSQDYNNYEERRVIINIETPAAINLGEGTRTDHGGQPYWVPAPRSR
jgi:RHS repeat-associated protein